MIAWRTTKNTPTKTTSIFVERLLKSKPKREKLNFSDPKKRGIRTEIPTTSKRPLTIDTVKSQNTAGFVTPVASKRLEIFWIFIRWTGNLNESHRQP